MEQDLQFSRSDPKEIESIAVSYMTQRGRSHMLPINPLPQSIGTSPMRKKRGRLFPTNSAFTTDSRKDDSNDQSVYMFNAMSQDSTFSNSQFSQDFGDRFGQLNVRSATSDDSNTDFGVSTSQPDDGVSMSNDGFHVPFVPFSRHRSHSQSSFQAVDEASRQITLAPPIQNPFLPAPAVPSRFKKSTTLWLSAFKERPRFIIDFHEEGILGEGTFSTVYRARRRLDGTLYAVKKLKSRILSESEGKMIAKEVCALAALQGCPNLIQYYSSWIDDGYLHIQTELCSLGTLDVFVSLPLRPASRSPVSFSSSGRVGLATRGRSESYRSGSFDGALLESMAVESVENLESNIVRLRSKSPHSISSAGSVTESWCEGCDIEDVGLSEGEGDTVSSSSDLMDDMEMIAWVVMHRISDALRFMHARGMAHLDLRPANIFLASSKGPAEMSTTQSTAPSSSSTGGLAHNRDPFSGLSDSQDAFNADSNSQFQVQVPAVATMLPAAVIARMLISGECLIKLGDLGHATPLDYSGEIEEGESRYCCRELIKGGFQSNGDVIDLAKADIFSLGVTVYELCLGRPLGSAGSSEEATAEWHSIRDGHLNQNFVDSNRFSVSLVNLLKVLIHPDPVQRPTSANIAAMAVPRPLIA